MPAQEPDLAGPRRGRRGRREIDLERRRAGRDTEEVVQLLSASDRSAHRLGEVVPALNSYGASTVFIVWNSIPGLDGSSKLRIAECSPDVPGRC